MKKIISTTLVTIASLVTFSVVSAHVIVSPNTVNPNSYQTFSMSVPSERAFTTTRVRLLIPAGITSVTPTVKPGWTIVVKKQGTGTSSVPTEIDWTAGAIPAGYRDDFSFSTKVPASGTLQWKAYQLYSDGTEVGWDQGPSAMKNMSGMSMGAMTQGPYSQTMIGASSNSQMGMSMSSGSMSMTMIPGMTMGQSVETILLVIALALTILNTIELMKREGK